MYTGALVLMLFLYSYNAVFANAMCDIRVVQKANIPLIPLLHSKRYETSLTPPPNQFKRLLILNFREPANVERERQKPETVRGLHFRLPYNVCM